MPLTPAQIDERHAFAIELAQEAGTLAARYFADIESLEVRSKGLQDVVSQADVETEMLIKSRIAERFPDDAFLGEETGAEGLHDAEGIWVVDPIDGTQPVVSGLPNWCVSIAFVVDGVARSGVVFNPVERELFAARERAGATLNGRPIRVREATSLEEGIVTLGYSRRSPIESIVTALDRLLRAGGMFSRNGSGALGLCYVANGRFIGYVEPHINSWDCLAGLLCITEAGGVTNDWLAGDALLEGNRIVAGPPGVYDALDALLP